jgi:predicted aspartyl protease
VPDDWRAPGIIARVLFGVYAALLGASVAPAAQGACKLVLVGEIPVDTAHNRLITVGTIDGQPATILIDTGTPFSLLRESAARRLGLPLIDQQGAGRYSQQGLSIYGVGGQAGSARETAVKRLQIGSFARAELSFLVVSDSPRIARYPDLLLGDALLSRYSTEFDLAHRMVRLFDNEGCKPDQVAYWANTYSLADMAPWNMQQPRIEVTAVVNGRALTAILDTGVAHSIITRAASERVGVAPWRERIPPVSKSGGLGSEKEDTWVGTFATFAIGDEAIKNVRLLISDLFRADLLRETGTRLPRMPEGLPDVLIGCDFFLSHRMLVLSREHKLVFTYNGGPIFAGERKLNGE